MTNTIPNVPRELLERAATSIEQRMCIQCEGVPCCMPESLNTLSDIRALLSTPSPANHVEDVRAMLAAPSPAGVDGLEVVAWLCEWMGDKCGGVYSGLSKTSLEGLRRSQGEDVLIVSDEPLCRLSDAQAIIDGLRGDVAKINSDRLACWAEFKVMTRACLDAEKERDQQAQRIGELEGLLLASAELIKHGVFEGGICCCGSSVDSHGFGDGHSPVDALAYHAGQVCERIDAALSAGKEGE